SGRDRGPGLPAVLPGRRGGAAPPAGALRAAVRHLAAHPVPAPGRVGGVQADARRPVPRAGPVGRGQAVLHLPQPRLLAVPAGDAPDRRAGSGPGRTVVRVAAEGPEGVPAVAAVVAPRTTGALLPPLTVRLRQP